MFSPWSREEKSVLVWPSSEEAGSLVMREGKEAQALFGACLDKQTEYMVEWTSMIVAAFFLMRCA